VLGGSVVWRRSVLVGYSEGSIAWHRVIGGEELCDSVSRSWLRGRGGVEGEGGSSSSHISDAIVVNVDDAVKSAEEGSEVLCRVPVLWRFVGGKHDMGRGKVGEASLRLHEKGISITNA